MSVWELSVGGAPTIAMNGPTPRVGDHVVVPLTPDLPASVVLVTAVHHGYQRPPIGTAYVGTVCEARLVLRGNPEDEEAAAKIARLRVERDGLRRERDNLLRIVREV